MDQSNELLQALLSDPERLSAAVSMVSGMLGAGSGKQSGQKPETEGSPPAAPPVPAKKELDAVALLRALKPFLSEERQEKVDYAIKILTVADLATGFRNLL